MSATNLTCWSTYCVLICWASTLIAFCQAQTNKAPIFLFDGDMSSFSIKEDTKIGAAVYTLQATDPEGSRISYGINSDYFTVDKDTGEVILTASLDRESLDVIEVTISATDQKLFGTSNNTIQLKRQIAVLDANDNAPKFQNVPYVFAIDETASVGELVFDGIIVTDKDAGINAEINLECVEHLSPEACQLFDIDVRERAPGEYQGLITLKNVLDYEERPMYILTLKAEDMGLSTHKTSLVNVIIEIKDEQDQPPVFLNAPYFAALAEGTPPDMSVLTILVQDGDKGNPKSLDVVLTEENGYFKMLSITNNSEGLYSATIATTNNILNREDPLFQKNDGQYLFHVKATEVDKNEKNPVSSVTSIIILVTDINDHKPQLSTERLQISISEDISVNSVLSELSLVVGDFDLNANARFNLYLESEDNSRLVFDVEPKVAYGMAPISIKVINPDMLDYEEENKREYNFKVVSVDELGRQSQTSIRISVHDANDNDPIFSQHEYSFIVDENSAPGTVLSTIKATDQDSGLFGQVSYFLQGFGAEWFSLNSSSGELSVADCGAPVCLDYENRAEHTLTCIARDGSGRSAAAVLVISIQDVNDNPPMFIQREVIRNVHAGALRLFPPLVVKATDNDGPTNGNNDIVYKLEESHSSPMDTFLIDAITGEISLRKPLQPSDTAQFINLHVVAEDKGSPPLKGSAYVIITVTLCEHISHQAGWPSGKTLFLAFGKPGVGTLTGSPILSVVFHNCLQDMGERSLFFVHPLYNASVLETDHEGTNVIEVVAVASRVDDKSVMYRIAGGAQDNFMISPSGVITVAPNVSLDLENAPREYTIIVEAVAAGDYKLTTATTTVHVTVEDVNNKPPAFVQDHYVAHVSLASSANGDDVIVTVTATDSDDGHLLRYELKDEAMAARDTAGVLLLEEAMGEFRNVFQVNATSGEVRKAAPLDHSHISVMYLTVQVRDNNAYLRFGEQMATAEVIIYVEQMQELSPSFPPPWTPATPQIIYSIPEEPPIRSVLFTLTARNPSSGGAIKFEKLEDEQGYVQVDENMGMVILQKRLDFESLPASAKHITILVKASASDGKNESSLRSSTATVIIDVQDINDNSPVFARQSYQVSVAESITYPHTVLTVQATDLDQQFGFGKISYSLSGDDDGIFTIDPVSGAISLIKGRFLDREVKATHNLKVTATDNPDGNGNQRRASALVLVQVTDVNDNAPVFEEPLYQAIIPETVAPGFSIKQVKADDVDSGGSTHIIYSLDDSSQLKEFLVMNRTTGHLIVGRPLSGKGRIEPYKVVLRATDQDGEADALSTNVHLLLFITDVSTNDGIPNFVKPTNLEKITVSENSPEGTIVTLVEASDPDDPKTDSGRLRYSFLGEGAANSDQQHFAIDPFKGTITTRERLDFEAQCNYSVVVVVRDFGNPPQHSARLLNIHVIDVDDHPPLFLRPKNSVPLKMEVDEEVEPGTIVGYPLEATDEDEGANAAVEYTIINGNEGSVFAINSSAENYGMIYVRGRLDMEQMQSYLLTVQARKMTGKLGNSEVNRGDAVYDPSDLSMVQVLIKVRDVDDNPPIFLRENATIGIKADTEPGVIIFTFEATDNDLAAVPIIYDLVKVHFFLLHEDLEAHAVDGGFIMQRNVLLTMNSMSLYHNGYFVVHVRATSGNKTTDTNLTIFVLEGRELLKFVFNKPLAEVQKALANFKNDLQQTLLSPQPITVNLYDSHFAEQEGLSNASSLCFNFFSGHAAMSSGEVEAILDLPSRPRLAMLYHNYGVDSVTACSTEGKLYTMTWAEICVLVVAALIVIASAASAIIICRLHKQQREATMKLHRTVYQVVRGAAVIADTNGNGYSTINRQRIHEWQESSTPTRVGATYGSSYA